MDLHSFYTGNEFETYTFLGAHVAEKGVVFRTYAPAAHHVAVIGEFNGWSDTGMHRIHDGQFWECYIENACHGQMYNATISAAGRSTSMR